MQALFAKWNGILTDDRQALFTDVALLILRVSAGLMMAFSHGLGKVQKILSGDMTFADPIGIGDGPSLVLAAGAEFFCSLALVVGLATRLLSFPLAFTMFVAAIIVHADDPFGKKEFGLLYLTIFVALILMGPGRFSIDAMLKKKFSA